VGDPGREEIAMRLPDGLGLDLEHGEVVQAACTTTTTAAKARRVEPVESTGLSLQVGVEAAERAAGAGRLRISGHR
jgi:hypothetical protein